MRHPLGSCGDVIFMGHEHQRDPLCMEFIKQVEHIVGGAGIQCSGGFIRQQQAGLVDDGSGDRDTLLLAAGELVRLILHAIRQTDTVQGLAGFLSSLLGGTPA